MASIFTRIVNGEIPCYKIAETDDCLAFLDVSPLAKGHVLVIPKKEIDNIFDLENALYLDLMLFAKKVAHAMKQVIPCQKVEIAVIGLEVPHAHIHLVPINNVGDINFSKSKLQLTKEELSATTTLIVRAFEKLV